MSGDRKGNSKRGRVRPTIGDKYKELLATLKSTCDEKVEKITSTTSKSSKSKKKSDSGFKQVKEKQEKKPRKKKAKSQATFVQRIQSTAVNHGNLGAYHTPGAGGTRPRNREARVSLKEVSANVASLDIRLPSKTLKLPYNLLPLPEFDQPKEDSSPVIIGLDWGSALTKVVIAWRQQHYLVDWGEVFGVEHEYLMPSEYSQSQDGQISLGRVEKEGWKTFSGFKVGLINDKKMNSVHANESYLFLLNALCYIKKWIKTNLLDPQGVSSVRWRVHMGLPTTPVQDKELSNVFEELVCQAWNASFESVTATTADLDLRVRAGGHNNGNASIGVLPEFAAQINAYLKSSQAVQQLHGLVDVGAGTLDVAFFNVVNQGRGHLLPILGDSIKPLGTHYLLAAMIGRECEVKHWNDTDAKLEGRDFAKKLGKTESQVGDRMDVFFNELGRVLEATLVETKRNTPLSHQIKEGGMRVFFTGGGSENPHFRTFLSEYENSKLKNKVLISVPKPTNLVGDLSEDQFHRVTVAYGLSMIPKNIGEIYEKRKVTPIEIPESTRKIEDRDATR